MVGGRTGRADFERKSRGAARGMEEFKVGYSLEVRHISEAGGGPKSNVFYYACIWLFCPFCFFLARVHLQIGWVRSQVALKELTVFNHANLTAHGIQ